MKKVLLLLIAVLFISVGVTPNVEAKTIKSVSSASGEKVCIVVSYVNGKRHSDIYYAHTANGFYFFVDPVDENVISASAQQLKNWGVKITKHGKKHVGVFDEAGYLIKVK